MVVLLTTWDVTSEGTAAMDVPLLSSLACDPDMARCLVPGKPVSKLCLQNVTQLSVHAWPGFWEAMARSTAPITHLTLWAFMPGDIGLGNILEGAATSLGDILVLKLRGTRQRLLRSIYFDNQKVIEIKEDLARFRSLQMFYAQDLFNASFVPFQVVTTKDQGVVSSHLALTNPAALWKDVCPELVEVVVDSDQWTWSDNLGWTRSRVRSYCWDDAAF
ncbi:hypothetical protein FRB93_010013 [Tulasnella sp. JGI-2019a]|nr:hypothetical protein FRB93_010013 [Tulasnella sp. JGI-2019a]